MPGSSSSQPPRTQSAQITGVQGPWEGHVRRVDLRALGGSRSSWRVGTRSVSPAEGSAGPECGEREAGALGDEDAGLGELTLGARGSRKRVWGRDRDRSWGLGL